MFLHGILMAALASVPIAFTFSAAAASAAACEPIKIDMCRSIGYNFTRMPNLANHQLQADANSDLMTFAPLIHLGCSGELQFFLCSVYAPMCEQSLVELSQKVIGPCRPLCERVRDKCEHVLVGFGYSWPSVLDCAKFPSSNRHEHMCMEGPGEEHRPPGLPHSLFNNLQTNPLFMKKVKEQLSAANSGAADVPGRLKNYMELLDNTDTESLRRPIRCTGVARPSEFTYVERLKRCVPRCDSELLFSDDLKSAIDFVLVVCVPFTVFLLLLALSHYALIPSAQFFYPERALLFLALCFLGLDVGFLFRGFLLREDIVCGREGGDSFLLPQEEGHRNIACFFTFLLTHFFAGASTAWFCALTGAWLCSQVLVVAPSRLLARASVFHAFAWGVSAVVTLAGALSGAMEAEEMTGVCAAGGQSDHWLLYFVLLPETFLLLAVVALLVVIIVWAAVNGPQPDEGGAVASWASKRAIACQMSFAKKMTFCCIFLLIKVLILSSYYYEYYERHHWRTTIVFSDDLFWPRCVLIGRMCLTMVVGAVVAIFIWLQSRTYPCTTSLLFKKKTKKFSTVKYSKASDGTMSGSSQAVIGQSAG